MAHSAARPKPQAGGAFWVMMGLVSAAVVACLWVVDYLPTNDGPQHILAGHLENHYSDPGTVFASHLEPTLQFASRGFSTLFVPLEAIMEWRPALRVTLSIILLANLWGFVALLFALTPDRRFLAPLGALFVLSWPLYMGFYAFLAGTAVGLMVIAAALSSNAPDGVRPGLPTPLRRVLLAAGLVVQACAHVFTAVLSGFVVALLLVARAPKGRGGIEVLRVAAMGSPAMVILLLSVRDQPGLARMAFSSELEWSPLHAWFTELPHLMSPGPAVRGWLCVALVFAALLMAAVRWRRGQLRPDEGALTLAAAVLVLLGLFAPINIPGWQFFQPRFFPLGSLLALALLPAEQVTSPRARELAMAATGAAAVSSLLLSARLHRRLAAGCAEALSGLDAPIRRTFVDMPVVLDAACGVAGDPTESEVPFLHPLQHAGALYAVAEGGTSAYTMEGSSSVHAFRIREDSPFRAPAPSVKEYWGILASDAFVNDKVLRKRVLTELATYGSAYESIILFGARPEDETSWIARGYVADFQNRSLLLAHFQGCALSLSVPAEAASRKPHVQFGVWPVPVAARELVVATPPPGVEIVSLKLNHLLCGEVWLRVYWDNDGSGSYSNGDSICRGADEMGRLRLDLSGDGQAITCSP